MTNDRQLLDFDVIPRDTTREAWAVQTRGLRKLGVRRRVAMAFEMSDNLRRTVRDAVRGRHPGWNETFVRRETFRAAYGDRLYNEVFGGSRSSDE